MASSFFWLFTFSPSPAWDAARRRPAIAEWARDMPTLVDGPPRSERLDPVGGIGLDPST